MNYQTGSVEESKKLQLYSYWRSSCAFRVRIALNLKGLEYEYKAVNLLKGEQTDPVIADSFAIIMAANIVAANIQPLQNLAVLNYIQEKVGPNETTPWLQTHIRKGFEALEKLLKDYAGKYATGDEIYVADLFLAPQIYAAVKRIEIDMYTLGCLCLYRHPSVCMRVIFVSTHFLVLKEHGTIKNL
ncbi:glutathione S-transferase zeta class-like isoform X3 [Lycium barbarum]|uniref:glutathione S-transferase zeta class-like isoform X3 n=1 Tax=Lycium barbarum TaxID=112863 RepID=UPI00293E8306|nr:glutathione S-transferase zeta class-like isoform X3 [Lycium barbarum]